MVSFRFIFQKLCKSRTCPLKSGGHKDVFVTNNFLEPHGRANLQRAASVIKHLVWCIAFLPKYRHTYDKLIFIARFKIRNSNIGSFWPSTYIFIFSEAFANIRQGKSIPIAYMEAIFKLQASTLIHNYVEFSF